MMIQYALHESAYLDAAKYFYKVWETPTIKEEVNGRGREVSNARLERVTSLTTMALRLSNTSYTTSFSHHMTTSSPICSIVCSSTLRYPV